MSDKLQNLINDGTITEGDENTVYEPRTPILLGKEYLATIEGFRVDADPASLFKREYLAIVDFSALRIADGQYPNDLSNSVLNDGRENYFPIKVTKIEEDARFKRFDLVFSVPISSRVFELTFYTGLDAIKKIRFKVDMNSLENKAKDGIPGGCMFLGIEQIPLLFN